MINEAFKNTRDYVFSTMPVKDLVKGMKNKVFPRVQEISTGLIYRDFFTVGLLLEKLKIKNAAGGNIINNLKSKDNTRDVNTQQECHEEKQ